MRWPGNWSLATALVLARLVHLRAAMRLDAGRDPARDRQLALDGGHLRLHADARLPRLAGHLQCRGRSRRGMTRREHDARAGRDNLPDQTYSRWGRRWRRSRLVFGKAKGRRNGRPSLSFGAVRLEAVVHAEPNEAGLERDVDVVPTGRPPSRRSPCRDRRRDIRAWPTTRP